MRGQVDPQVRKARAERLRLLSDMGDRRFRERLIGEPRPNQV